MAYNEEEEEERQNDEHVMLQLLPGEDKASCTSKEQCGRDDIYDKNKNMHRHPDYSS